MNTMLLLKMLKCVIILVSIIILSNADICDDSVEHHFGTKSAYRYGANKDYRKYQNADECAKKVWMFIRHGTRYPSKTQIRFMQDNLQTLRDLIIESNGARNSVLVKSDVRLFEKWRPNADISDAKKLTIEGEKEMLELAERMQARFPKVLSPIYTNTSYVFKYTKTQRTKLSARYFSIGLFDKRVARDVYYPEPLSRDPILRFYKLCDYWQFTVKKNFTTYTEREIFAVDPIMKSSIEKIGRKLGLSTTLTFDDVHAMYVTCAFESAWNKDKKSPWCIPFDLETVKVLEYAEDLKYYWVDGYGYDITHKQACPAFEDMFNFIANDDTHPKGIFYFTHSGALLKLLCHLGLYKDSKPLLAADYRGNGERKWRVSKIDPFGGNLAFVLYDCENVKKILTLHNEKPVRLPPCPDDDFCPLSAIKEYYVDSIDSCKFNQMCKYNKASAN